jgi:hypothetical protein
VGIIDTLVPFRWRKKLEYWLKVERESGGGGGGARERERERERERLA